MDAFLIVIGLCFLGLFAWMYLRELGESKRTVVIYGYPSHRKTWLTVYINRSTGVWEFEWDDLFDSGRPASMYPLHLNMMVREHTGNATDEEYQTAMELVEGRY